MAPNPDEVTAELVVALLHEQHPDLADLPVRFAASGWDNQLWRLGNELAVRLPLATGEASKLLLKEYSVVPQLASRLPLQIPVPQRLGWPTDSFPYFWIVTTWVEGQAADRMPITRGDEAAVALARFIRALHEPAPVNAPIGRHRRGGILADSAPGFESLLRIVVERGLIHNAEVVRTVWDEAMLAPPWSEPAVWLHGDLHPANLLVSDGVFSGVIDFGDVCAGDPACDLAGGWLLLPHRSLGIFHEEYGMLDTNTLQRARGWAVLKALACLIIGDNGDKNLPGGKSTWGPPAKAALYRLAP